MLRKALLLTIAALAVAIPLTAVWGQSPRREQAAAPTLVERIGNFGREIFGPPEGGYLVGDPFASDSGDRRTPTPARRSPERVANQPNNTRREPVRTANRDLPRSVTPPPLEASTSNRRRRPGAEGILAPQPAATAAIPRRDTRENFTPAMPRDDAPTTVTKRRRTYQSSNSSSYAQQPEPRPQTEMIEPATSSTEPREPARRPTGRGYAPHLARGHAPLRTQDPTPLGVPMPEPTPAANYRTGEPTLASSSPTVRTRPGVDEPTGPQVVRNRHVEEPRAGSIVGTYPAPHDDQAPRVARSQQVVVDESYSSRRRVRTAASLPSESATPPDYELGAEQDLAADRSDAEFAEEEPANVAEAAAPVEEQLPAAEALVAGELEQEAVPDAIATDIGAEGRSLAERLSAARKFSAPTPALRDPSSAKPRIVLNPAAPAAPGPDAEDLAVERSPSAEVPALATSEVVAEEETPSQALIGIPRTVTRSQPAAAPHVAQLMPAAVVETVNDGAATQVAASGEPQPDAPPSAAPTEAAGPAATLARAESPRPNETAPATPNGDTVLLTKQGPALAVETIGPRHIKIDQPARYRVVIGNSGDVAAEGVAVTVALPEWADVVGANASTGTARALANATRGVEWRVGRVEQASRQHLELEITARRSEPLALDVRWSHAPIASQTRVVVEEPKLEMKLEGPDEVNYGELESFALRISNPGNGDAEQVVVRLLAANPDEEATEQAIGTIAAGDTKTVDLELSAHKSGTFWIKAEAAGEGGLHSSVASEVLVRRAALAVALEGPPFQYAGTEGNYRVRLINTGNAVARNIELRALLPVGAQHVVSTENSRIELADGRVVWGFASLAAGEEREFEFSCKLVEPGTLRPQVVCTAEDDLTASDGTETTVEALADLSLEVRDPRGPVPVGSDARFEVRIKNRGTSAAHEIDVVAFFAEGVEPVQAIGAEHQLAEGQVMFDKIATLEAGEELVLAIVARSHASGNHAFRVELVCPELETSLAAEESTHFYDRSRTASTVERDEPVPAVEGSSPSEPVRESTEEPTAAADEAGEASTTAP